MHAWTHLRFIISVHLWADFVKDRGMQDIMLRATQEAQSFIVESLNGYNFGQTFVTLQSHLQDLSMHMEAITRIKMDVMQVRRKVV